MVSFNLLKKAFLAFYFINLLETTQFQKIIDSCFIRDFQGFSEDDETSSMYRVFFYWHKPENTRRKKNNKFWSLIKNARFSCTRAEITKKWNMTHISEKSEICDSYLFLLYMSAFSANLVVFFSWIYNYTLRYYVIKSNEIKWIYFRVLNRRVMFISRTRKLKQILFFPSSPNIPKIYSSQRTHIFKFFLQYL
jgi:hypothetical protein